MQLTRSWTCPRCNVLEGQLSCLPCHSSPGRCGLGSWQLPELLRGCGARRGASWGPGNGLRVGSRRGPCCGRLRLCWGCSRPPLSSPCGCSRRLGLWARAWRGRALHLAAALRCRVRGSAVPENAKTMALAGAISGDRGGPPGFPVPQALTSALLFWPSTAKPGPDRPKTRPEKRVAPWDSMVTSEQLVSSGRWESQTSPQP